MRLLCLSLLASTLSCLSTAAQSPPAWGGTRVALANNVAANEWLLPPTVNRRFKQAVDAGVNYVYLSPKWNELEPSPGKYKFSDIDFQVAQADKAGLPLILQLRAIDTNRKSTPSDLVGVPFDDPRMQARLFALLDQLQPHLHQRVAYCLFGNEIDSYFKAHPAELLPYTRLYQATRVRLQQNFPGAPVSASITFDSLPLISTSLRPLLANTDFLALTYYPLNPDFTVRLPSRIAPEIHSILAAAGSRKVLLQEVGYPSSPLNNSSQDLQADFVDNILQAVTSEKNHFIGINFLFMCDFSDRLSQSLTAGYNLPNADRFKAFLQTLGLFDGEGKPKKSWASFQRDVPRLTR